MDIVAPMTGLVLDVAQFTAGIVTLLVLLRILYVLSANPIGEFTAELVYLRAKQLRSALLTFGLVIVLDLIEYIFPFLVRQGWLSPIPDVYVWVNALQAILVMVASLLIMMVVGRYTHRALDRRIRESMETLAYLEGQRRRRRSVERGEWERRDED